MFFFTTPPGKYDKSCIKMIVQFKSTLFTITVLLIPQSVIGDSALLYHEIQARPRFKLVVRSAPLNHILPVPWSVKSQTNEQANGLPRKQWRI